MALRIGPRHICDEYAGYEPGDVLERPSQALLELAASGAKDPETGLPYVTVVGAEAPAAPVESEVAS